MGMFGGYYPMKQCQGERCTNRLWVHTPAAFCPTCQKKREVDGLPEDPEELQMELLRRDFLGLGFTESEARQLAEVWADPVRISWWLEQGCSHRKAVAIAT